MAVVGAGAGGLALAADMTRAGVDVRLLELPEFRSTLEAIRAQGGIRRRDATGEIVAMPAMVTDDPAAALSGVELIQFSIPAFGHRRAFEFVAPHLTKEQFLLVNTGYWAALRSGSVFSDRSRTPTVCESTLLPYAVRKIGPATIHVDGVKNDYPVAALPADRTARLVELVRDAYPQARPMRSVLETSLENLNPLFHPAITLLDLAELERSTDAVAFYSSGCTPAVGRVIDAVDQERRDVGRAVGLDDLVDVAGWLGRYYGATGFGAYAAIRSCPPYQDFRWPATTAIRYVHEDVPYALVPLTAIAERVGVPAPATNALIDLCALAFGRDYRSEGPGAAELGIAGLGPREISELARAGGRTAA